MLEKIGDALAETAPLSQSSEIRIQHATGAKEPAKNNELSDIPAKMQINILLPRRKQWRREKYEKEIRWE